ncbi:MAG: hypothetical protein ACK5UM_03110 [Pseudomonadota bacterium]|jgi:hypothetical protein|nr:hypothetical protein [Rubrivivax sp.]MCA3259987.1 hypothetical protein [Rubrivivax sp.]MCE2911526.1 hypothetical protein [Rubrivivax sp.]MCZ8032408.1 hypothetical protein [Rubrivivax sp.]
MTEKLMPPRLQALMKARAGRTPEAIGERFAEISDPWTLHEYTDVGGSTLKFLRKAAADAGVDLSAP